MGKKKNKNKVSGAVKTATKTDKKLASKLKKELANLGEEDITKVIAQIEQEEAKRAAASEKTLPGPPSARAYASLTPHPVTNELILFGGEYHDGKKTLVYNDLLFYNPTLNTWRQLKAPGAPPPRSAHQAVATPANKGEFWVFGGEFTSPSETQFYHYKDLWCFSLAEKKWEKISAPNGPSARSGHRMALLGRSLVLVGGYNDDGRECRYFNDVYAFCLDTRTWSQLQTSGRGPSPRSAFVMLPVGNDSVIVHGGFSRVKEGRTERALTHANTFRLTRGSSGWAWRPLSSAGGLPPRSGQAAAVNVPAGKGYVFGGISDVEETEEELVGEMSSNLDLLDLETCRWHEVSLKSQQAKPAAEPTKDQPAQEPIATVVTDDVFTMRLGPAPCANPAPSAGAAPPARPSPCARMSAMLAAHRGHLFVYGGVLEKGEKQFYLSDMYSLDLHKLNEWKTIVEQPTLPDWLGSESESDEESGTDSGSDTEDDE